MVLTSDSGEKVASVTTKAVPREVHFSPCTTVGSTATTSQLSISDSTSLYVCNVKALRDGVSKEATVQLDFNDSSDSIVHHCWCVIQA